MTEANAYAAHLKSWADEIAMTSGGRTCAKTLLDAAIKAWIDGKNVDDPVVRQELIAYATR